MLTFAGNATFVNLSSLDYYSLKPVCMSVPDALLAFIRFSAAAALFTTFAILCIPEAAHHTLPFALSHSFNDSTAGPATYL
jgi:hypothetical protein